MKVKQQFVSVKEAAERLGVRAQTVKNWGNKGVLTMVRIEGHWAVDIASMKKLMPEAKGLEEQQEAVERLRQELAAEEESYTERLAAYRQEVRMREDCVQFTRLAMRLFHHLFELLWDEEVSEREREVQEMFLLGVSLDSIAERVGLTRTTVVNNVRKAHGLLNRLRSYMRMLADSREAERNIKRLEYEMLMLHRVIELYEERGFPPVSLEYTMMMVTPIEKLSLSRNTVNALKKGKVECLGDLLYVSRDYLMHLQCFGKDSYKEVSGVLGRLGFEVGERRGERCGRIMRDNYHVCKAFYILDADKKAYLKTLLGDLAEDKAKDVVGFINDMLDAKESYDTKLQEYERINGRLRKRVLHAERKLAHGDFYLMPGYEEAKKLFEQMEKVKHNMSSYAVEGGTAAGALSLLDCIFSPEAYQAESRRVKRMENENRVLKRRVSAMTCRRERMKEMLKNMPLEDAAKVEELQEEVERLKEEMERLEEENKAMARLVNDEGQDGGDDVTKLQKKCKMLGMRVMSLESDLKSANVMYNARERFHKEIVERVKKKLDLSEGKGKAEDDDWDMAAEILNCHKELDDLKMTMRLAAEEAKDEVADLKMQMRLAAEEAQDEVADLKMQLQLVEEEARDEVADLKMQMQLAEKEARDEQLQYLVDKEEAEKRRCHEADNFWHVLRKYEEEVDGFNRKGWHKKAFAKLAKHSDSDAKTLDEYLFELAPQETDNGADEDGRKHENTEG